MKVCAKITIVATKEVSVNAADKSYMNWREQKNTLKVSRFLRLPSGRALMFKFSCDRYLPSISFTFSNNDFQGWFIGQTTAQSSYKTVKLKNSS